MQFKYTGTDVPIKEGDSYFAIPMDNLSNVRAVLTAIVLQGYLWKGRGTLSAAETRAITGMLKSFVGNYPITEKWWKTLWAYMWRTVVTSFVVMVVATSHRLIADNFLAWVAQVVLIGLVAIATWVVIRIWKEYPTTAKMVSAFGAIASDAQLLALLEETREAALAVRQAGSIADPLYRVSGTNTIVRVLAGSRDNPDPAAVTVRVVHAESGGEFAPGEVRNDVTMASLTPLEDNLRPTRMGQPNALFLADCVAALQAEVHAMPLRTPLGELFAARAMESLRESATHLKVLSSHVAGK